MPIGPLVYMIKFLHAYDHELQFGWHEAKISIELLYNQSG